MYNVINNKNDNDGDNNNNNNNNFISRRQHIWHECQSNSIMLSLLPCKYQFYQMIGGCRKDLYRVVL